MKNKSVLIILGALVFMNILDGSFINPSPLDWVKFVLMAMIAVLYLVTARRRPS
jgi:hypothetical protein